MRFSAVLPIALSFILMFAKADETVTDTYIGTITGTITVYTIYEVQTTEYIYSTDGSAITTDITTTSTYTSTVTPSLIAPATSSTASTKKQASSTTVFSSDESLSTSYSSSQITGTDGVVTPVALEYVIRYVGGCSRAV